MDFRGRLTSEMLSLRMDLFPTSAYLTKVRPAENMRRFYALQVMPDLFGGCSLIRRWAASGHRGRAAWSTTHQRAGRLMHCGTGWKAKQDAATFIRTADPSPACQLRRNPANACPVHHFNRVMLRRMTPENFFNPVFSSAPRNVSGGVLSRGDCSGRF